MRAITIAMPMIAMVVMLMQIMITMIMIGLTPRSSKLGRPGRAGAVRRLVLNRCACHE